MSVLETDIPEGILGLPKFSKHLRPTRYLKDKTSAVKVLQRINVRETDFEIYPERVFVDYVTLCLNIEESAYGILDHNKRYGCYTRKSIRAIKALLYCYDARKGYLVTSPIGGPSKSLKGLAGPVFRFLSGIKCQ